MTSCTSLETFPANSGTDEAAVTEDGLWVHLPLDGSVEDEGPNQYPFVSEGGNAIPDRNQTQGGALLFGETPVSYTQAPLSASLDSFTLSAWVKLNEPVNEMDIRDQMVLALNNRDFAGGSGAYHIKLLIHSNAHENLDFKPVLSRNRRTGGAVADVFGHSTLIPGRWYHLAAMRDASSGKMSIWVNGRKEAEVNDPFPAFEAPEANLILGQSDHLELEFRESFNLQGALDDVRIYKRALRASEIQDIVRENTEVFTFLSPAGAFFAQDGGSGAF